MEQKSVLFIDDSPTDLRAIVNTLKRGGFRIVVAFNGYDGISRATVLEPDVILCDLHMPDLTGFTVLRRLKSNPATRRIPFIFMTVSSDAEDRIEGLRLGAVDFISKPAHPEEVLLRANIHTRKTERRRHNPPLVEDAVQPENLSGDASIFHACQTLLEADLSTNMSVDQIAESVGTHRKRLTDIFKKHANTTVYGYLKERRMQAAKNYLRNQDISVQSIADLLGFTSAPNFATAFKERFSMSPTAYRKQTIEMGDPPSRKDDLYVSQGKASSEYGQFHAHQSQP
jgi:CheY-like chemotaxis protein